MLGQALAPPLRGVRPAITTGVQLSRVVHRVFPERAEPVYNMDAALARTLIEQFGRDSELDTYLASTGNSFIAMSEALLAGLPGGLPDLDAVLLAYHAPDLYKSDVAGCYLAGRLPGTPVPCALAAPGPGAPFLALRVADALCRLGELTQGVLFGFDQNAVVWEAEHPSHSRPDAAVLIQLGARGEAAVAELDEAEAGGPGDPTPARVLAGVMDRHPAALVVAGAGLAAELDGPDGPGDGGRVETVPGLWSTGVWAGLARRWPLRQPVLLADYEPVGARLHTALLVPASRP
jgi:hypothetical protein